MPKLKIHSKKIGPFENQGVMRSDGKFTLSMAFPHEKEQLGKISGADVEVDFKGEEVQELVLTRGHFEAKEKLSLRTGRANPITLSGAKLISPLLVTDATELTAPEGLADIDRLRVIVRPSYPFQLIENLQLNGVFELAEEKTSLDSAQAKAELEAVYAPIKAPLETDATYRVNIFAQLKAKGFRVFVPGSHMQVGLQPIKYDEPGYDHTIGTKTGALDIRAGEIDIFAHTFDLQKGVVIAQNGAIRAPNLIHLGRLVRDPDSDVFATFFSHEQCPTSHNLGNNIFNVVLKWGGHTFSDVYDGRHLLRMPFFSPNASGICFKEKFLLHGKLKHQATLEGKKLTLGLTAPAIVESGKINVSELNLQNNLLTLCMIKGGLTHDYYTFRTLLVHKKHRHLDLISRIRQGETLVSEKWVKPNHTNCTLKSQTSTAKQFSLSAPSAINTQSISFENGASLHNVGSILNIVNLPPNSPIKSEDVVAGLFQKRISGTLSSRNSLSINRSEKQLFPIRKGLRQKLEHNYRLQFKKYALPKSYAYDWGGVDPWYPCTFLQLTNSFEGAQQTFSAQTTSVGPVAVSNTVSLESQLSAPLVLVRVGSKGLVIGSKSVFRPPPVPIYTFDREEMFKGFYELNPAIKIDSPLPKPFNFLMTNIWFDEGKANDFYKSIQEHIIVRGQRNTLSRHQGNALFIGPPKHLIEHVRKGAQERLGRGVIEMGKAIDAAYVQVLHQNASKMLAPFLQNSEEVYSQEIVPYLKNLPAPEQVPFLYYTYTNMNGQSVLEPELFIPMKFFPGYKESVRSLGTLIAIPYHVSLRQVQRLLGPEVALGPLSLTEEAFSENVVPHEEQGLPSGSITVQGDIRTAGSALIMADGDVFLTGALDAEGKAFFVSLKGNVALESEFERHATAHGFRESLDNPVQIKAMSDIVLVSLQGMTSLKGVDVRSEDGNITIQGKHVNVRALLLHSYQSYHQGRSHITRRSTKARKTTISAAQGGVKVEGKQEAVTAGVDMKAGEDGIVLTSAHLTKRGTYESDSVSVSTNNKRFLRNKTSHHQSSSQYHVSDSLESTGGIHSTSSIYPYQALAPEFILPKGQMHKISSVHGAEIPAAQDIHQVMCQSKSSNFVRSVMEGRSSLTRIPRPMQLRGGGRLVFEVLPSILPHNSSRPALYIELGPQGNDPRYNAVIPGGSVLNPAWLEGVLDLYPGQIQIEHISLVHQESHYRVVSLSPVLSVATSIAVGVLTQGVGASLLGVTSQTSIFFANAGFTALSTNLAQGIMGTVVGDERALERSFNENALKSMVVNIAGQYVSQEACDKLGIQLNPKKMGFDDVAGKIAVETVIKGTLNGLVFNQEVGRAYGQAAISSSVNSIGSSLAAQIGKAKDDLSEFLHKGLHGVVGAGMGAALNSKNPGQGALSGAFGAVASEIIAEALTPVQTQLNEARFSRYEEQRDAQKAALGRDLTQKEKKALKYQVEQDLTKNIQLKAQLATVFASSLIGLDPEISNTAAKNALENNFVNFVISAGMIAWSAYEALETYREIKKNGEEYKGQAVALAIKQFGRDALLSLVGGKIAGKLLGMAAGPAAKLFEKLLAQNPLLRQVASKLGIVIRKVKELDDKADALIKKGYNKTKEVFKEKLNIPKKAPVPTPSGTSGIPRSFPAPKPPKETLSSSLRKQGPPVADKPKLNSKGKAAPKTAPKSPTKAATKTPPEVKPRPGKYQEATPSQKIPNSKGQIPPKVAPKSAAPPKSTPRKKPVPAPRRAKAAVDETSRVRPVNGRKPINHEYAGKTYPLEKLSQELRNKYPHSVPFTGNGYPDFSRYAMKKVKIKMTGTKKDFDLANKAAGYSKTPKDHTWHHHHDGKTMQLVSTDIHDAIRHTGGVAIVKK